MYVLVFFLVLFFLVISAALLQSWSLNRKARGLPGPSFTLPFIGNIVPMLMTPFKFYEDQEKYGRLSWNSLLGMFIVFSKNTDITRKVFNLPESFELFLTAGAKKILGENNIAFMSGEPHKQLRRQLLPLFQPRALSIYVPMQERVIRKHIDLWCNLANGKAEPLCMQPLCRDLNMETSQNLFVGPYIDDPMRVKFEALYWKMNEGFLCFPLAFPGSTLWKAMKAREELIGILANYTTVSRKQIASGETPDCMLDVWMEAERQSGDRIDPVDAGYHLLDFLFASQDATTSAMVWIMTMLAERRDWRARVLAEQDRLRPNDEPLTYELLEQMEITYMFVKEILRYRPPATMVPHKTLQDTKLTDDYTVPKGSIVLPSIWCASHEGYTNPESFDPERFSADRDEQSKFGKHFMVFGHGPHMCIGRHYAMNHLIAFTALVVKKANWERIRTAQSDDIIFLPTIFPGDKLLCKIQPRSALADAAALEAATKEVKMLAAAHPIEMQVRA